MNRVRDPPERRHVCRRILAPRIPGAVHLVGEADDRGHALGAVARQQARQVRGNGIRHRGQPAPRLERDHQDRARIPRLAGRRVEVGAVIGRQRERHEADDVRGWTAERRLQVGDGLRAPVDVHTHPDAGRRAQAGERAEFRRGVRGRGTRAGGSRHSGRDGRRARRDRSRRGGDRGAGARGHEHDDDHEQPTGPLEPSPAPHGRVTAGQATRRAPADASTVNTRGTSPVRAG